MATPELIPTDLTLDIGIDLAPEDFVGAVKEFFGYVSEITASQKGDGAEISWAVRVREGSALIGVEPRPGAPSSRLDMIYKQVQFGVLSVGRGEIEASGLNDKAVQHLRKLSDLAAKKDENGGINLWVRKKPIQIGGGISQTIQEGLDSDYYDFGSLEGRLEAIQDVNGSLRIRVKDFLYPKAINCIVPEKMIDLVFNSFRRRVEIEGKIHYRRDGTPISIEASSIEILPEDDDLPTADDVRGILASA